MSDDTGAGAGASRGLSDEGPATGAVTAWRRLSGIRRTQSGFDGSRPSSTQLSAVSQAIIAARSFMSIGNRGAGGAAGGGAGGPADDEGRLTTFLEVLMDVARSKGGEAPGLSDAMQKVAVGDLKMSKGDVRRVIDLLVELEKAAPDVPMADAVADPDEASSAGDAADAPGAILVFGGVAMDMIGEVDNFPKPNSTQEANDFRTAPGGKGANEAVACGKLGSKCFVVGRVGRDDFGRTMTKRLATYVNVDGISIDDEVGTGFALIVTASDTQHKTNTICKGANEYVGDDDLERVSAMLDRHRGIGMMLLTLDAGDRHNVVMGKAAALGRKAGKLVILRASPLSESRGIVPELWQHSSIIIVTEAEAAIALGVAAGQPHESGLSAPLSTLQQCSEAATLMMARGDTVAAVIVSSPMGVCCRYNIARAQLQPHSSAVLPVGSDELSSETEGGFEYSIVLPCFRGPVVDVVGAVDALAGGIAAALSRGVPLTHALVWGTACCARSISEHGAQDSMPSLDQLHGFFRMERIRVRDGRAPSFEGSTWPADKPLIGASLRGLEELLHSGNRAKFQARLFELKQELGPHELALRLDTAVDFQGHTLLHLATLYSDVNSVASLLASGASLAVRDNYGLTPLMRCHIEFRAARKVARERFAIVKFCMAVVDQVNKLIASGGGSPPAGVEDTDVHGQPSPTGTDPSPSGSPRMSARMARASAPSEAFLEPMSDASNEEYDCGDSLSPMLRGGWAHSLLSLMTLSMDEQEGSREHMEALHALSNFLMLRVLRDPDTRGPAIAAMTTTKLERSGTTFAHGLAHCATEEVIEVLQDKALSGEPAVADAAAGAAQQAANAKNLQPGWHLVRDSILLSRVADSFGRTLLHYAMIGENDTMCGTLLNWGHDMYARDVQGQTPMAYCQTQSFAERVKKLQLVTDAFVSVGHTTSTDRVMRMLVQEARKEQLKLWWDKGGQEDGGPGIRPGQPWTAEIEKAMKKCKIAVVMLTKKWLSSKYCGGEGLCALSYNKQIITILPPVPPEERASIDDIPSGPLKAALTLRQVFDFSTLSDAEFLASLPKMFDVIQNVGSTFPRSAAIESAHIANDTSSRITKVMYPPRSSFRWGDAGEHVFLVCGAPTDAKSNTAFTWLLANQLVSCGIPVSLGFKPVDSPIPDPEYAVLLRERIESCNIMAIVMEDINTIDYDFLNMVAQSACQLETKVVIVPYTRIANTGDNAGGFGYTAHLMSPSTCCFTDWMGSGAGLQEGSPIFQECFEDFLFKLDSLHRELTIGIPRRRSSPGETLLSPATLAGEYAMGTSPHAAHGRSPAVSPGTRRRINRTMSD